jgi:exodeoxyribonuclease V alpha subunit
MQIKNNYNITWTNRSGNEIYATSGQGVFNGDEGIIEAINLIGESLTILFDDGRKAQYDFSQLDEIEPAYAITIHKSQGSEYKVVVIPVHSGPPRLLSRNLLYTAVTRAREMVVLVGTEGCIEMMVDNDKEVKRYSALDKKILKFDKVLGDNRT